MWSICPDVGNVKSNQPDIIEGIDPDPEQSLLSSASKDALRNLAFF